MPNNVAYLDIGLQDVHDLFAELAEDASVEGAVIIHKRHGQLEITGGNISTGEMAIASLLLQSTANKLIIGDG